MEIKEKLEKVHSLREAKEDIKRELDKINNELTLLNGELVEYFQDNNLKNMRIEGIGMFFMHSRSLPQVKDIVELKAWLEERGDYEMMLSFNTRRFQSYYNELLEAEKELPSAVEQFVKTEVRLRR